MFCIDSVAVKETSRARMGPIMQDSFCNRLQEGNIPNMQKKNEDTLIKIIWKCRVLTLIPHNLYICFIFYVWLNKLRTKHYDRNTMADYNFR